MSEDEARSAAERIARHSYGKLVAYLSARTRDVPAAEDALSDALAKALQLWPRRGVPDNPGAWLLVAARRNLAHKRRHGKVIAEGRDRVVLAVEELAHIMTEKTESDFPDDRLKLLFVCTHPAIERTAHTPLMLQTVLGLDAKRIASAFLVSPATVGQRLVRAKAKIREAGIPFAVPEPSELPGRLGAVLAAIYAAYTLGWNDHGGSDEKVSGLTTEAIWLARLLLTILPAKAEAIGLLSLMLYSQSRHRARRDEDGAYIPPDEQDPALWDTALVAEADGLLVAAGKLNAFGPYQCEAAIQAVHAERRLSGKTNWLAIAMLYEALLKMRPTIGAEMAEAAVIARLSGPEAGLRKLAALRASDVQAYQPYWAVRAHLLGQTASIGDAWSAYGTAIGLSDDEAVRRYLQRRMMALSPTPTSR
jgi:RNA polymerase sigma-70 factor (ECF subfamily)